MKKLLLIITILLFYITPCLCFDYNIVDNYFGGVTEKHSNFTDVKPTSENYESIDYLYRYGIINGMGDGTFAPLNGVTRAQFVKMMICAFGLYDSTAECNFDDCKVNDWYYPYVASAYKIEMVNGMGDGTFGAELGISRQEMFTMAYRMAVYSGIIFDEEKMENEFSDEDEISDYAKEAIYNLYKINAITPNESGNLRPLDKASREESAKLIYLMLKNT